MQYNVRVKGVTIVFKSGSLTISLGLKGNSKVHNDDCERFVDWFIQQAGPIGNRNIWDWHQTETV